MDEGSEMMNTALNLLKKGQDKNEVNKYTNIVLLTTLWVTLPNFNIKAN